MKKASIARNSLLAGIALTAAKIGVGIASGSLALLSDGLHSLLDLLASLATWQSVRISELPADQSHPYGHEKVESLAAFGEGILLFLTALYIGKHAVEDMLAPVHPPTTTFWPLMVVLVSITVDITRSTALWRSGRKYKSAALLADAAHYSIDIAASVLVVLALAAVHFGGPSCAWADPAGALCIAGIMLLTGFRMGLRSADALMDRAPEGLAGAVQKTLRQSEGVRDVPRLRVRQAGRTRFVDATIKVDSGLSLEDSHRIASGAEEAATGAYDDMDITLHVEPDDRSPDQRQLIERLAREAGLLLHALHLREYNGRLHVDFHVRLPATMQLGEAHAKAQAFEQTLRTHFPQMIELDARLEPG